MFKRTVICMTMAIVLVSNLNIPLSLHFCGDLLTALSILPAGENDDRCACGVTNKSGCCEDVLIKTLPSGESNIVNITEYSLKNTLNAGYFLLPALLNHQHLISYLACKASFYENPYPPPNLQVKIVAVELLRI